ncbi:YdbC family protein [Priestia sp. OVS21]|nr:YdbC family protein [Priestia sp. OVS21]
MLTKIVKCSIPTDKKASFSYTQQHWAALAHVNGFIGQLGVGTWKMKQMLVF